MTLKAVPTETIVEIVDDIFLPLVNRGTHPSNRSGPLAVEKVNPRG